MKINIYKLSGDYVCTGHSENEFDIEAACNSVFEKELVDTLYDLYPEYKNRDITVKTEWIYEGYRLFIYGVKLSEEEVENLLTTITPVAILDYCDLFWDIDKFRKQYTGVLLAYDMKNYHRVTFENHSFITLTHGGLEKFLNKVSMGTVFNENDSFTSLAKTTFSYIHDEDLEVTRQKLKGEMFEPVKTKVVGKIHSKLNNKRRYSQFK